MSQELSKTYEPEKIQQNIMNRWLATGAFDATPDEREPQQRYVIVMPLPNVTGALHMGHAMDNVMQDLLIRWHRMQGHNTLWQPGTDHAGIATQAVVEKRLFELEGRTRHDIGREGLVERIWKWKDEYQSRIVSQQQQMGCSCDWRRQRFTMDEVCSAALREAFFRLFTDRLIYQGDRLVNWDCKLQTAVADDEVYHETVQGHFWHLRYPVIDSRPGEPDYIVVATTRPETMMGDTAVACHPEPARALESRIAEQLQRVADVPPKDKATAQSELERLKERRQSVLPVLERLVRMARDGRNVRLPLVDREIPLILDEWAKPEMGSGCVKITPAHDANDYEVWQRHTDNIDIINILCNDGTLNVEAGPYVGLDRLVAREKVLADLKMQDLVEAVEDREIEIGHSDRSKTPIEPYITKQWFVRMGDVEEGIECGQGTSNAFRASGLAQAAIDATDPTWSTPSGHRLTFHPPRYKDGYVTWLSQKRDWCISRQLWWGHRIPVWSGQPADHDALNAMLSALPTDAGEALWVWVADDSGMLYTPEDGLSLAASGQGSLSVLVCSRNELSDETYGPSMAAAGLVRDPDVLDTWFSSSLWPFSTLGWPDPNNAPIDKDQASLGAVNGIQDAFSYYYPGSCLVTARDIITLWVARMVILGLYLHGDTPFKDCFVHAKILDGRGLTMSKSKGNGIDPVDIIERYGVDAMRYQICDMETGMQDVRLPVQAICPSCQVQLELAETKHGRSIFTYVCTACGMEFDVLGTMEDVPAAKVISDRFEVGRAFCTKLWNSARFALMNLEEQPFVPLSSKDLLAEDRWILSRLNRTIDQVTAQLNAYRPSEALNAARDFFWGDFCDWYLELIKTRMKDNALAPVARQVLAATLDQTLRLLHPFLPFITEALWSYLAEKAPVRGIDQPLPASDLCILAAWPKAETFARDDALEAEIEQIQALIGRFREIRSMYNIAPRKRLLAAIRGDQAGIEHHRHLIIDQARLSELSIGTDVTPPLNAATQVMGHIEIFLGGVLDPIKERERLLAQQAKLAKQLQPSRKKMANPDYLEKAPASVVDKERKKLEELETQLAVVEKNLADLG
ncbi:MAG: valine--tRNA ligase [bacterium]|nr:valine--tRNA ligase [bacterium]